MYWRHTHTLTQHTLKHTLTQHTHTHTTHTTHTHRDKVFKFMCSCQHCMCLDCFSNFCKQQLMVGRFQQFTDMDLGYSIACPGPGALCTLCMVFSTSS